MPNQNIIFGSVIGELRVSPVAAVLNAFGKRWTNGFFGLPAPLFVLGGGDLAGGVLDFLGDLTAAAI